MSEDDRDSLVGEVKYTTQAARQRRSVAVAAPVRTMLVKPAAEMTPSRVSAVAGRLGVSAREVQELVDSGRPVPVKAGLRGAAIAREQQEDRLDVVPAGPPGLVLPALAAGSFLGGGGALAVGAALALVSTIGALALGAVGAVLLLASFIPLALWIAGLVDYRRTSASWRSLQDSAFQQRHHELVGQARVHLAEVRQHLADADLPEPAEADVRSGLKDLEDDLATLARSWDQLPAGAPGKEARERLQAQVGRVSGGLEDLRAWLTRASMDASEGVGEPLQRTLAAAQLAVDGLSG